MKTDAKLDAVFKHVMGEIEQTAGGKIKAFNILGGDEKSSITFYAAFENEKEMAGRMTIEELGERFGVRIQAKFI
jgi:hypothetical protein